MYGDCQIMSNMGGNMVTSDNLFSSSMGNPNFNFMPNMSFHHSFPPIIPKEENGLMMLGKEDMESGSGSEQLEEKSANEQESTDQPPKKKRYHRHTARQIQEMEAMFKECPHPDDKQRMKLSQDLGLKPRQVKFWFQNRRTQMKAQQDRSDNIILRAENESLKNENYRLQVELRNLICPNCGGSAVLGGISFEDIRIENARLKDELERVCCIASHYCGRPIQGIGPPQPLLPPSLELDMGIFQRQFPDPMSSCSEMMPMPMPMPMPMLPEASSLTDAGIALMEDEKARAMEFAMSSMNELLKMCHTNEPLWLKNNENGREVLNLEEHERMFPWNMNFKKNPSTLLKLEGTRDEGVVIMNSITLVDAFLDANKWMELFPSIVAKSRTVQILTPGISGPSGSLHLMYAEVQALSPLVPTREAYFLRYCQQNVEEETWVIVDFPLDHFRDSVQTFFPVYRRRSSGCVIQDLANGYSRVKWVERAEVEEKPVHQLFSQFLYSGMAFGARRWLGVLQRQCERVASLMARNISDLGVIPTPEARKNLMRLAQRMIRTFCMNISTCNGTSWTALSDSAEDTVRITTRKITEPGQPNGVILSAVSTSWLPYSHYHVFDVLRDEHCQSRLDVLSNGNALHEVAHIANGSHPGNCISLLRINVASNSSQHVELMLQESCIDHSGGHIVYTTVNVDSIQLAMSGEDPSRIPLLPLGFIIVPVESIPITKSTSVNEGGSSQSSEGHENIGRSNTSGCLLTVMLQVLASTVPSAKLNLSTVNTINNHLRTTVHQITAALTANTTTAAKTSNAEVGTGAAPTSSSGQ